MLQCFAGGHGDRQGGPVQCEEPGAQATPTHQLRPEDRVRLRGK